MKELLNYIENRNKDKLKFIKKNLFIETIKDTIKNFFPSLNYEDIHVLEELTIFTVDIISFKYGFEQGDDYYLQWQQNNCSDIKGVILLLLPFIDDKDNSYLLRKLTDLNHMIYSKSGKYIPKNILELERDQILQTHFKYGNMGIGLLPFSKDIPNDVLLDLYPKNEKLIYKVIEDNFYGLLQTLDIINGKTYINWINIQPLNLINYHNSYLYKETEYLFLNNFSESTLKSINIDYGGLWIGDIYNVIRNYYYEEGKKVKCLFFTYDLVGGSKYLINILNELINLEKIINNEYNNFDDLDEDEQLRFKKEIIYVLDYKLNNDININVISSTIFWLIKNYSNKDIINIEHDDIKLFKDEKEKEDEIDEEENEEDTNVRDPEYIKKGFKYICTNYYNHLWNYLKESIQLLMASPFGKFLIKRDDTEKIIISNDFYYKPFNKEVIFNQNRNIRINIKNIYNISKSLSHRGKDEIWRPLDKNFISLDYDNRKTYFNHIFGSDDIWFDISSNYRRETRFNPIKSRKSEKEIDQDYFIYKKEILEDFRVYLLPIIFEELISIGILNKFTPNLQITDKTKLPQNTFALKKKRSELIKKMFNKEENKINWADSYYFITNDKFKYLPKMRIGKKQIFNQNDKYDEKSYFDVIATEQEWTTFYAMNWISQISFFQHYIFHQVLYVTGATGQGKSTQVPKLLMYACKMYDYNLKANVICTQPRITPTTENASRIAEELGLPIEQVSNNSAIKIKTDNFYVQYKYEAGSHTKKVKLHLVLKIVTDGTLFETIKSNPTLKKSNKPDEDGEKKEEIDIKYSNGNTFDVIIVDEAHEHNINMDIIITLGKQACYFNNQVKLIIVSATMDDDEPIYRSYFKIINDKLLYPIKNIILNPFNNQPLLFNPVHMDRRYHISPPGETTQYRVTEIYLEKDVEGKSERENAKIVQNLGYERVIEICNKSPNGEILFFCTGENEIKEAVEYLNQNMPQGNIALPFFSKMNQTYKDIITKINSKIYNIKNRRENIHLEWNETYIEDLSVPAGLYKRSVIIATNVAEASVTIPGLAFVVDNGYAKENTFNRELNISKLIVDKISESSRLQRKGRVGRVADGMVYYMYTKGARKDVKPKYKITQQDITDNILNLTSNFDLKTYLESPGKYNYTKLIVSDNVNPNMPNIVKEIDETYYSQKTRLIDIFEKNYKINNDFLPNDYYLSGLILDSSLYVYNDGQRIENLLDIDGTFYLIHPYENIIKRNVINNIIKINNKNKNIISPDEYKFFLRSLIDRNLLIDINSDSLYIYPEDYNKINRKFVKTELAVNVLKLKKDFDLDKINDSITLIAASSMNCLKEVLEIRIFLNLLLVNGYCNLSKIMNENKKWDEFKKTYTNQDYDSDIIFIYNIIKKLKSKFNNLVVFNINKSINNINNRLNIYVNKQVEEFKKILKKNNEPNKDYSGEKWNKLKILQVNGILNSDKNKVFINDLTTLEFIFNDIKYYEKEIIAWAENNYFDPKIILNFIYKLGNFYLTKLDKYNINEIIIWSKNFSSNFNKCLTDNTLEEKLIRSFLYGNSNQFTFNDSNILHTTLNFSIYEVNIIIPFTSKNKMTETVTNIDDFMFYLFFKEIENLDDVGINKIEISFLSKIKPIWLIPTLPLVYNSTFNDIIYNKRIRYLNSYTINKLNKEFTNNWSIDHLIWNVISPEIAPILNYYYRSIFKVVKKMSR